MNPGPCIKILTENDINFKLRYSNSYFYITNGLTSSRRFYLTAFFLMKGLEKKICTKNNVHDKPNNATVFLRYWESKNSETLGFNSSKKVSIDNYLSSQFFLKMYLRSLFPNSFDKILQSDCASCLMPIQRGFEKNFSILYQLKSQIQIWKMLM